MQNPFAWFFRKVFGRFYPSPAPPKPSLSRDQVRELLIEALEDPATVRLLARRLLLPAIPVSGASDPTVTTPGGPAGYFPYFTDQAIIEDFVVFQNSATGKVGVGTASPAFPLHVVSSRISDVRSEGPNYAKHSWKVANGGTDQKAWQLYADAISNALFLGALNDAEDAQTAALHIKRGTGTAISSVNFPSGNVGIGTASPGHKLDVAGSGGYNQSIYSHASDGGLTRFGLQNTSRHWTISNYGTTVSPNGIFAIADETAGNVRLAIDTSGNVGIGTTSPVRPLHVKGGDVLVEQDPTVGGGFAIMESGKSDPTTVLYRAGSSGAGKDISILRNYNVGQTNPPVYSILKIWAPSGAVANDREATLTLARGDNDEEYMDVYNNGYSAETQYGIRIQKRGTGSYRDFVIDKYSGSGSPTTLVMVKTEAGKVGIGNASPNFVLHTSGSAVALGAPSSVPSDSDLNNSNISFYLDQTNHKLKVRVKYSDGTLKTGEVSLT